MTRPYDASDPTVDETREVGTTLDAELPSPSGGPPRLIARSLMMAEKLAVVDRPAGRLAAAVDKLLPPAVSRVLRGQWLGHPLHPILVTVPIGAWMTVPILDVTRQRAAARQVLLFGMAAAVPASVTGLVEYTTLDAPQRRVAIAHITANTLGISCLATSWVHRRRDAHMTGLAWTLAGLAISGIGGALGGHLSYAQGAGVYRER